MNAALGGVSAGGIGTPEFDVTQSGGGPCAFVATQSGGNAGGVTPSKFSLNVSWLHTGRALLGLGAQPQQKISTRPQPVTLFGGPAVPHCVEAIK